MPPTSALDNSDSVRVAVRIRPQTGAPPSQLDLYYTSVYDLLWPLTPTAGYERVEKCKDCVGANKDMVMIGDRRFASLCVGPIALCSAHHDRVSGSPSTTFSTKAAPRFLKTCHMDTPFTFLNPFFCAAINLPIQR